MGQNLNPRAVRGTKRSAGTNAYRANTYVGAQRRRGLAVGHAERGAVEAVAGPHVVGNVPRLWRAVLLVPSPQLPALPHVVVDPRVNAAEVPLVGRSMADWLAVSAGVSEPDLESLKREAPLLVARAAAEERLDWSGFLQQSRQWALKTTS